MTVRAATRRNFSPSATCCCFIRIKRLSQSCDSFRKRPSIPIPPPLAHAIPAAAIAQEETKDEDEPAQLPESSSADAEEIAAEETFEEEDRAEEIKAVVPAEPAPAPEPA